MAGTEVADISGENASYFMNLLAAEYDKYFAFSSFLFKAAIALTLLGVIANCIVCGVLFRKKRLLKSFSNFHLFNLALTDIFYRVVIIPTILIIDTIALELGNNALCKFVAFGSRTTLAVTFVLLLGIALDRYANIVRPLKARSTTWKHSRNIIVVSWFYAAICSSPLLYSMEYMKIKENATETYALCLSPPGIPTQISSSIFVVFAFLVPLGLVGVAYGAILRFLWLRARKKVMNNRMVKARFRAVKMMVVIVTAYLLSWGPFLCWSCLQDYEFISLEHNIDWESETIDWEETLREEKRYMRLLTANDVFFFLTFTSSVLNPLIFGYYNNTFRQDLKACCCGANCLKRFKNSQANRTNRVHVQMSIPQRS